MKKHLLVITFLMGLLTNLFGQITHIEIRKGTVLTYAIKEGSKEFLYTVIVKSWDEDPIVLNWKTNEKPAIRYGTIEMNKYFTLDSDEILVSLNNTGKKVLEESQAQIFAPANLTALFEEEEDEIEFKVNENGKLFPFKIDYNEIEPYEEKELIYKGKTIISNYLDIPAKKGNPHLGFIQEYNNYNYVLAYYKSNGFSMDLTSVKTPEKETTTTEKPASNTAVKKPTSTKMEPQKLAVIKSKYPLLATLEAYDVTENGKEPKPFAETYDFRQTSGSPNPPSAVDCFTADLQILYKQRKNYGLSDMTETLEKNKFLASAAEKLLGVYGQKEARNIPGYKPWTHWKFVKTLSATQKTKLAAELENYIKQYGFTE